MYIERPLDLLNELKGKKIKVFFKDKTDTTGTLLAFDMHINIALQEKKDVIFLRGDNILSIIGENEKRERQT